MIASLRGQFTGKGKDSVVIEVNGVGFQVIVPRRLLAEWETPGMQVQVHTYLHVRENELTLYGFNTEEELRLFHNAAECPVSARKRDYHLSSCLRRLCSKHSSRKMWPRTPVCRNGSPKDGKKESSLISGTSSQSMGWVTSSSRASASGKAN